MTTSSVPVAEVYRRLDHALQPKNPNATKRSRRVAWDALEAIDTQDWSFSAIWFRDWLMHLLSDQKLKVSSAYRYKGAIGTLFLALSADLDFQALDGDNFVLFYESLIERWSIHGGTRYRAARLDQLHRFGVQKFDLPPLPYSLSEGDNATLVHARMVPETVFLACRERLCGRPGMHDEHREALWVYLTILYRGGLRQSELVKLLRRDISIGRTIWLFIRDNRFGNNKSRKVKVPISALLLPEERTRVADYLRAHQALTPTSAGKLVFHETGLGEHLWNAGEISREATRVLRELAPGESFTLHSFRHTAFSRLALVLARSESLIAQCTPFTTAHCQEIRGAILKETPTGQHDFWCLAALAAHGCPIVTFRNYIHVLPLILHERLSLGSRIFGRIMVSNLAGVTHTQAGHWVNQFGQRRIGVAPRNLRDQLFAALKPHLTLVQDRQPMPAPGDTPETITYYDRMDSYNIGRATPVLERLCLNDREHSGSDGLIELAELSGIPMTVMAAWLDRMDIVLALETQRPRKKKDPTGKPQRMKRHLVTKQRDRGFGVLPRRPNMNPDHEDIPTLIRAIEDALPTDRVAVRALIRQWLTRMHTSASGLPVDTPEELGAFFRILTAAIDVKQWRLRLFPLHDCDPDTQQRAWAAVAACQIELHKKKVRNARRFPFGKGELYLRSRCESQMVESFRIGFSVSPKPNKHYAQKYTSSLLRYVLFYAAIVHLETFELRAMARLPRIKNEQLIIHL